MEREIKTQPLSRVAIFAGIAVAIITIGGTIIFMERSRREPVAEDVIAALPNRGEARERPENAARVAIAGAAAMQVTAPGAPAPAPAVEFRPDENQQRAFAAMAALGNATTPAPAPAPNQPAPFTPIPGFNVGGGVAAAQDPAAAVQTPPGATTPAPQTAAVAPAPGPAAPPPATAVPRPTAALETAWGRPGDPRANMRVFEIDIRELHDGRMWFDPYLLNVRLGEQVRIVVRNTGDFPHSVVIATEAEVLRAAAEVKANPQYWRGDANWLYVMPTEKGEIVWQFTRAGQFEFVDVNPGRREAGLVGRVVVR
jgi:uncharacterized cupredoxin-like copper-binding protein